jgi:hypothetical protein
VKDFYFSFFLAFLLIFGTGCRRGSEIGGLRSVFGAEWEVRSNAQADLRHMSSRTAKNPSGRSTTRRGPKARSAAYVVDAETGPVYLAMAVNSGAPAFILKNGKRVVHSTSPLEDPAFRLAAQIQISGRTHYTYREVY